MSHPSTVLPLLGRQRAAAGRRAVVRPVPSRRRWLGQPLVVEEELFRDVVLRERKRADRFEHAFAMVLVALKDRAADRGVWKPVVTAIGGCCRDTDIVGWLDGGTVLGVLMPDAGEAGDSFLRAVESRIHAALANHLDPEERGAFRIRLHHHSAASAPPPAETRALLETLSDSRTSRAHAALKRVIDLAGGVTLLVTTAPLFALIAGAVKLTSSGPVFFRQPRIGRGGTPFTMLKFRTMRTGCDSKLHQEFVSQFIKAGTPAGGDAAADVPFKIVDDPRVTLIGRFLRRTSLDELPQFWNVLRGEMSLVGPRPPLPYEVEQYEPWHYRRVLEATPGITGLWQVNGRSRTTFDDMVRLDLRYAKSSSAWMDLKILLATPRAVVSGKGAV